MGTRLQLQLVVTAQTSPAHREILATQIAKLHPREKGEIEVLEWDGESPPHAGATNKMRRYALSEVCTAACEMGDVAVMNWQRNWRTIDGWRVHTWLHKAGERWVPMYICLEGNKLQRNLS